MYCSIFIYAYSVYFLVYTFSCLRTHFLVYTLCLPGTDYPCTLPSTESTLPVATIDGYVKLANNDYNSVMNALATIGPLAINVDASTWHAYEGGIFNGCNQKNPDVNHVVVMVGYGEVRTILDCSQCHFNFSLAFLALFFCSSAFLVAAFTHAIIHNCI